VPISESGLRPALLRYIAGRSTEFERAEFEERLLADQEFSDAAAVCEQELIDAYALQQLNADDMEGLRPWVEASPQRMQRVEIARALLLPRPQKIRAKQRMAVILAIAACVLAAVTLHVTHRPVQSVPQTSATNGGQSHGANGPSVALPTDTKSDVILLVAERTRGDQQIANYQVHRAAAVQLQVMLSGETAHSGYTLQVVPVEGPRHILLEKKALQAQSMNGQLYLNVTLPPGSLPPATYAASVSRGGETLVSHFTLKWSPK
jgi:hypothetical protein